MFKILCLNFQDAFGKMNPMLTASDYNVVLSVKLRAVRLRGFHCKSDDDSYGDGYDGDDESDDDDDDDYGDGHGDDDD